MSKDSFILYTDALAVLDELSDQQAGKLFKAIYAYQVRNAERCYQDEGTRLDDLLKDFAVKIAFVPFKAQFIRDEEKYKETIKRRSNAGKKGMNQRYGKSDVTNVTSDNTCYDDVTKLTQANKTNKCYQDVTKLTSANKTNTCYQDLTKLTQANTTQQDLTNLTDSVSVNDSDNVIIKERVKKTAKRFSPPSLEEVKSYIVEKNYSVDAESFFAFYQSKDWYVGRNKMKDWHAALITWDSRIKKENATTTNNVNDIWNKKK